MVSQTNDESRRRAALIDAEERAFALLEVVQAERLIQPGRTERDVEKDIYTLALERFGVEKHWHKRIVRAGENTLTIAADNPPIRTIDADDMVYIDLGPVFDEWEADVGRTYVMGDDARKHKLCADLPRVFDTLSQHFREHEDITGAELYAEAQKLASDAGWLFGGRIAGHIVGEFPHAHIPGDKDLYRISPDNLSRMRDPDAEGQAKHWIIEVHLVDQSRRWGGFYEQLLRPVESVG
ncbi:MAG: M24 family metallopeptidase [Hyphomicrobiaceae bacterium]